MAQKAAGWLAEDDEASDDHSAQLRCFKVFKRRFKVFSRRFEDAKKAVRLKHN